MLEMSLYTLHLRTGKMAILYKKLRMKLYLSDENTHEDLCPHIGILLGLDSNDCDHCDK